MREIVTLGCYLAIPFVLLFGQRAAGWYARLEAWLSEEPKSKEAGDGR